MYLFVPFLPSFFSWQTFAHYVNKKGLGSGSQLMIHIDSKLTQNRICKIIMSTILKNNLQIQGLFFFKLLLGCPTANFGPLSRGQPHSPDVNHCVFHFRSEGHQEPRSEVGFLSPAEHLVRFEPGTFRFLLQRLNPLGHSPLKS